MKNEDIELVNRLVKAGIKDEMERFAKAADKKFEKELEGLAQSLDGANMNIMKLQAQITGLVNLLEEKGAVGRNAYNEKAEKALIELAQLAKASNDKAEGRETAGAGRKH